MTPKRIQRKRTKGWTMPEGAVTVDRNTIFGNPFRIHHWKLQGNSVTTSTEEWTVDFNHGANFYRFGTKAEAVAASLKMFSQNARCDANIVYREKVKLALRGKDLACWCPLDQPCHADVLLEIANEEPVGLLEQLEGKV